MEDIMTSERKFVVALPLACIIILAAASAANAYPIFYRMLGADSNAPFLPKTYTVYKVEGTDGTGSTGMADTGFTEYPRVHGTVNYTYREDYAFFPRIVSSVESDPDRVNVGDILIDHVYDPDGVVWGPAGRKFVQSFVATGRELVSVTLLVATPRGVFRAALLEGGLDGRQVGPSKTFTSGHSMEWGCARWIAGQAPLIPGRTYAIKIWREDAQRWSPYLHSTGNCYDDGMLYIDGRPLPNSDLAAWIVEEPVDVSRALIEGADPDGWVYDTDSFVFIPRTPNVRLISVVMLPVEGFCMDMVCRVYTTDDPPKLIAGPERNLSCGKSGGDRKGDFLFATDTLPVTPGQRYLAKLSFAPHEEGKQLPESDEEIRVDMRCRVYGDTEPGALPAIHNMTADFEGDSTLKLSWAISFDAPVEVELWRSGTSDLQKLGVNPGVTELTVPELWAGNDYDFRAVAVGPTGLRWRTPTYRIRMPGGHPQAKLYDYPEAFVPLAPPTETKPWDPAVIRYRSEVAVTNPDFENGLKGWEVSYPEVIYATGEEFGISAPVGNRMAGWTHVAGEQREQVFQETEIHQKIPTTPGHAYLMSARVHTSVANNHPRGDTRVRLMADPKGGTDFGDSNITQWFWTDGRWLTFYYQWTAEAEASTVGFGFFRWRDLDRASAYVDHVKVYDLGAAARTPEDPPSPAEAAPKVALVNEQAEADDRVEASLQAPPGYVITGLGARAHADNVTTLWIKVQPLLPDGKLGEPEELRSGWEADANLEARIDLPDGYVATGFGARIGPEWDIKTLAVWGRPLLPDGLLGEEKEFRAGFEPGGGLEKSIRLEKGRALTSAGLRCAVNDVAGISGSSAALIRTAAGR
jgi:hypothetical protein